MKNSKRVIAGLLAFVSAFGLFGCGSTDGGKNGSTSSISDEEFLENYEQQVEVQDTLEIEAIPDGAETELRWFSYFDLNPTRVAPEIRTDLDLFQQKGGSIKYESCTSTTKYQDLATALLSNDPPDIFWYEMKMTFPANVVKDMFQPVDSIVDFDSSMWADVKDTAENFTIKGQHYVAPVKFVANSVITYDKQVIDDNGLDDPYQLYLDDEWDWNAMRELMEDYVGNASGDQIRYGINGWFAPFIFYSTGETLIKYDADNNEYVSNLYNGELESAAQFLYDLKKDNLVITDWIGQASDAFSQNILFYAMGPWASAAPHSPADGDEWGMVPIPKQPGNDTWYNAPEINAYMWIKGSTKSDAVKVWMECAKIVNTDENYKAIEKDKFFVNNPNWTDEMYSVAYEETSSSKFVQMIDPGFGISTTISDDDAALNDTKEAINSYMYTSVMKSDAESEVQYTWDALRKTYEPTIEAELKKFNEEYKKFIGE